MPGLRVASIRSPPAAAIATPNGKKAPSEWKYEPRVEWSVNTRLSSAKMPTRRYVHPRTSFRDQRARMPNASGTTRTAAYAKRNVPAFVTSAPTRGPRMSPGVVKMFSLTFPNAKKSS